MEKKSILRYIFLFFIFYLLFSNQLTQAADLSFSHLNQYYVGQTFPVIVIVNSQDQAINAVSGKMNFSADKLNLVSISKASSILSLWVQEPTYSNQTGTMNFEGIVLNPGFKGIGGNVITLNFKALSTGTAQLTFSSGSILANDGQGTNILTNLGNGSLTIVKAAPVPKISSIIKDEAENVSQKVNETIQQPTFYNISSLIISIVVILIIFLSLVFFFGFLLLWGWRKIKNDIQKLRNDNIMEEKELADIKAKIMDNNSILLSKDIDYLKKTNEAEEQELSRLESKLENKTILLEKDIQQLKEFYALKEENLRNLELKLETELQNKTILVGKDLQQLKEINAIKLEELAKIEAKLEDKTIVFNKDLQQLREANTTEDQELLRLGSKLENQINIFEKDLRQLKESNIAEDRGLIKIENKTNLLEKDIKYLKETNTAKEKELKEIKDNIGNLNQNYKNIAEGQNELKTKVTKMIASLRAFYSSMILMDDTDSGVKK